MIVANGTSYAVHGHAIVSDDDRIADETGVTPASLRFETDWQRFQAALDRAAVTVLGRLGHVANPNRRGRNRLVLSSAARGIERRRDAWWWNPAEAPLAEALGQAAPEGGVVAVPGGRRVFDLFLNIGYDQFDLARAHGVRIAHGVPVFSNIGPGMTADGQLTAHGLRAAPAVPLEPGLSLTIWRKP